MTLSFTAATRDSLSNLAASLNAGKDKSRGDGFFLFDLDRSQVEAMYRGDWLARKIVDIVPYDMVREWRVWSGDRADVAAAEAVERRFGVRKLVQRALTLGRLYGGAAIIIGTGEEDPAALACELVPDWIRPGGIKFLHGVSRWQLGAEALCRDPLSPWFGEPEAYEITAPGRGALRLHPSRVIRFLGNELPDASTGLSAWSDSVLQTLYDAVHAVALTTTGATSLMHEAKVDIVTVPNLSEHLSSATTTAQLSARFAYAAAMKSINNLLLLGDGETWSRQTVDFGGLPEMVRTFLQVAAGAADIPVTRLLGQSPAGMSATGESDTRNYYDHVSARQELDLRPQLERLDALLLRSAGVDPSALTFEFRPLWQMDAAAAAAIALQKAQATRIYAGLNLWSAAVTAKLVQAQLAEDGTYPGAEGIFAEVPPPQPTADFDPAQPRDPDGRWTKGGGGASLSVGAAPVTGSQTEALPAPPPTEPGTLKGPDQAGGIPPDLGQAIGGFLKALDPIGTVSAHEAPASGEQETGVSAVPTAGLPDTIVRSILPLIVAALPGIYHALRGVAQEVAKHLPAWTSGGSPPDPNAPGQPAKPDGHNPDDQPAGPAGSPRPLTIRPRRQPASGPEESSPASPEPPPDDEGPDHPPHPAGREAAPSGSSGSSPPDPSPEAGNPLGLTIKVVGKTVADRAKSYEQAIRDNFGSQNTRSTWIKGVGDVDDVVNKTTIEVKYTDDYGKSIYHPESLSRFPHRAVDDTINQARRYSQAFPGGVKFYTNSPEFAATYAELFRQNGITKFSIVVVPSTR